MKSAAEEGTIKLYLDDFTLCECDANVVAVEGSMQECIITLDQTCYYPGGGGQPCDVGRITWRGGSMHVQKVRKDENGVVQHLGVVDGKPQLVGESVRCEVDKDTRRYHSRLHSAGHLVDLAVERSGYQWRPGRGAHFPNMSYVEYNGEFDATNTAIYQEAIQKHIDTIIEDGGTVTSSRVSPDEARRRSKYIPETILQKYELIHLATYNGVFDICCGGTHVHNVSEIGKVTITKVKKRDKAIRVSYTIDVS